MMRTLGEIIESAKDGNKPTHEECYWAMLALAELHGFDHRHIQEVDQRTKDDEFATKMWADDSARRFQDALKADPEKWLGIENDPANPEYQEIRREYKEVIEKFFRM